MSLLMSLAGHPAYSEKLMAIIRQYELKKYDQEVDKVLETIAQLQKDVSKLQQQVFAIGKDLEGISSQVGFLLGTHAMDQIPPWARDAVDAAVAAGVVDTPKGGSYDFYRFLTVLHRRGLI